MDKEYAVSRSMDVKPAWEPSAESVEALERELRKGALTYASIAAFILRRQHERESGLLSALDKIVRYQCTKGDGCMCCREDAARAKDALAAHAKLDASLGYAKPEPTLAEMVRSADERAHSMRDKPGQMYAAVLLEDWLAVKAAVEREERGA